MMTNRKRNYWDSLVMDDGDSSNEEDGNNTMVVVLPAVVAAAVLTINAYRLPSFSRDRLEWHRHIHELLEEGGVAFGRLY